MTETAALPALTPNSPAATATEPVGRELRELIDFLQHLKADADFSGQVVLHISGGRVRKVDWVKRFRVG